ncbi:MAG: S1 family peptidase [Myxococcaceae bacterium]
MVRRVSLSLFALLWACGPVEDDAEIAFYETSQEIVGGVTDEGDPAVVAFAESGSAFCTGTLIGKMTVLTAAHCMAGLQANAPHSVLFGTRTSAPTKSVVVSQYFGDPRYNGNNPGYDVGVLRLATAVTDVTPVPMNPTPLTQADIGKMLRHVGYGITNAQTQAGFGTKRQVTFPIRVVNALELESGATGKQTCSGDSGGPALMATGSTTEERVIGITSYGDENCTQTGFDTRTDTVQDYVRTTAAAWEKLPACSADGLCLTGCVPADVDCACAADGVCGASCADKLIDPDCTKDCGANGVCSAIACATPDPDCVATGGACTSAAVCVEKECTTDEQHPAQYCSRSCTTSSQCPSGMECTASLCKFAQRAVTALGQGCTAESVCASGGICAAPSSGARFCAVACSTSCSSELDTCVIGADGKGYCQSATSAGGAPKTAGGLADSMEASGCSSTGNSSSLGVGLMALAVLMERCARRAKAKASRAP